MKSLIGNLKTERHAGRWAALVLLGSFAFVGPPARAAVTEAWASRYNHNVAKNSNDQAVKVVCDVAGNFIVTGTTDDGTSGQDMLTVKYSGADGTVLWTKHYNGPANGHDQPSGMVVDATGNVIVTGVSDGKPGVWGLLLEGDYYTAKYASADGALLWEKRYNSPRSGYATGGSIAVDGSGNVAVTGFSAAGSYTGKYASADGALLWEKRYPFPVTNEGGAIPVAMDGGGNVIVTGCYTGNGYNYYTAKYAAADGALLWEHRYDSPANLENGGEALAIAVDASGNAVVTGYSRNGTGDLDYYTAKYAAANGVLLWERRYAGPLNAVDVAVAVVTDGTGDVVVTGNSDGYYTAKYAAADGALLWEKRSNGGGRVVAIDASGHVFVAGYSTTLKYAAADGALVWEKRHHDGGGASSLALSPDGTAVVTGSSSGDFMTIAFREVLPPSITVQPIIRIMTVGATATFTVTAAGTQPLAYQWRFNDANLVDKTNRSLLLANVQLTNAGNYSVVVAQTSGSVTSRVAALMFTAVHRFAAITANADHSISFNLTGVVPKSLAPYYDIYPLEVSTNLVDWSPLAMLLRTNNSADPLNYRDISATNSDGRFYRMPTNLLVTPFPKPSGPFPVGTISRLMTDPSRIRNTTPRTNSFMVTFWYPAEARAGVAPAPYVEKEITVVQPPSGAPSYWSSPATVDQFVTHAFSNLPLATNQIRYPVLLFSHGMGGHRRQNTDTVVDLASHGYVVVAMDHKDAFGAVFPGAQVIRGAPGTPCEGLNSSVVDYRTHEFLFVMDELNRLNTNDTLLAGRLDLERLGTIGKSMGAMTVAEVGRLDARCKAVVLLDAGYTPEMPRDLIRLGLQKPFLSISSTITTGLPLCPGFGPWLSASLALFTNALSDAFWCQIQGSSHNGLSDRSSLINNVSGTGDPTAVSKAQSLPLRACMRSFFDKYLKGEDDHLLDDPGAVYPNIINFRRK